MANIITYLNRFMTSRKGKDVRQDFHDCILEINKEVEDDTDLANETKIRQDLLEQKYDDQIAELANDEPQLPEIVDARQGMETLGSIIKQKVFHFNNVEDMKNCLTLSPGDVVQTLGYYEENDGGNGLYKIVNDVALEDDGGSVHGLENGLKAKLIIKNNCINVKQFGAYGDNSHNDTAACRNAIESARVNSNINEVHFPSGKYLISNTILESGINGLIISGENADYLGNLNSTIIRIADITVFNASGSVSLTERNMCRRMQFKNIYITDNSSSYTEIAFKLYYAMYYKFEDCLFSCYNNMFSFRNFYDSKFINCDFTSGGKSTDYPLINIDCGKHASTTEVGWDNTNWIVFQMCRFERYRGTAIKTTTYTQPSTYNSEYDPCVGTAVNKIFFDECKFESPYLTDNYVLDFHNASSLFFNIEVTVLDGQSNIPSVINYDEVSGVYGYLKISYYQTTVAEVEYNDFNNPVLKLNKCSVFDIGLIIGNITTHYKLEYLIEMTPNNNTYRTINIRLPYSYKNKKIYNTSSNPYNIAHQGVIDTYGESSYNGMRMLYDNTINDEWRISSQFSNNKHELRFIYKYGSNSSVNPITIAGDAYGVKNIGLNNNLQVNGGITIPRDPIIQDNSSRSQRYIGYGSSEPSSGYWLKGDIIFNNNPYSGGVVGWVCVSGGTSAVWKSFGTIS